MGQLPNLALQHVIARTMDDLKNQNTDFSHINNDIKQNQMEQNTNWSKLNCDFFLPNDLKVHLQCLHSILTTCCEMQYTGAVTDPLALQ